MSSPDFFATHHKLPEPGGYVSNLPSRPCGDCGKPTFEVVRTNREAKMPDGEIRRWTTVDVQCPTCPMVSDQTMRKEKPIGVYDTRTGGLTMQE